MRMNYFAESMADEIRMSLAGGVLVGLGHERVTFVSRDDVTAAIPGAERAAMVATITGKPVGYVAITVEQLRTGLT